MALPLRVVDMTNEGDRHGLHIGKDTMFLWNIIRFLSTLGRS